MSNNAIQYIYDADSVLFISMYKVHTALRQINAYNTTNNKMI